eukprot:CAMPEP_0179312854 /NCGR_PEP_ID=MMETSP0797-20121207/53497_1 /TAXON_ID=47934 /ORGANISM="Dinophysis acuminata, Strain DAEP01" /LENGTH=595 /DNA_ID=CAMNT_0021022833 /DNA_START=88 /DNA_END=1871 /DNA_ORIENTATION=-
MNTYSQLGYSGASMNGAGYTNFDYGGYVSGSGGGGGYAGSNGNDYAAHQQGPPGPPYPGQAMGGQLSNMGAQPGGYGGGNMGNGYMKGQDAKGGAFGGGKGGGYGDSFRGGKGGNDYQNGYRAAPNPYQNGWKGGGGGGEGGYDDDEGYYPRYNTGSGPEYAQDQLAAYDIDGQAEIVVTGKQGEVVPQALTTFEQCDNIFHPSIMMQLRAAGFAAPMPIQASTWEIAMQGRDVIGVAKTGSGKTLAFLLPGFMRILRTREQNPRGPHGPQLLALAPTRELARQIEEEAQKFGNPCRIRTACLYGGAPRGHQLGQMRRGVQVIVATPGRLNDFLESWQVDLSQCGYVVLDEADRMLDMGFEPQIRSILQKAPDPRQTLLYSATWAKEVRSLASDFLIDPICVNVGKDKLVANEDVTQHIVVVNNEEEKLEEVRKILSGCTRGDLVLIFCETKMGCAWLGNHLYSQYRIPCTALHGDLAQGDRDLAISSFKKGQKPIMVGTDVAARGLDIRGIKVVINFDPAPDSEVYVHRVGRTGRAGEKGNAYSLLLPSQAKKAKDIAKVMIAGNIPIPPELQELVGTGHSNHRKGKGKGKGKG